MPRTGAGSKPLVRAQPSTVDANDTFGVTVDGLGNNTVVRIWRNSNRVASQRSELEWRHHAQHHFHEQSDDASGHWHETGVWPLCEEFHWGCWIDNWFGGSL